MFDKILVATDASGICDAAVSTAIEITQQNNGKLYILHVLEAASAVNPHAVKHFSTSTEVIKDDAYKEKVTRAIENQCGGAFKDHGQHEIRVAEGIAWEEILRWASKIKADLIILGPHQRNSEGERIAGTGRAIGSTIEGVVMRESRPVMIVNRPIPRHKLKFNKVMVSIDFTKTCLHAFRFAVKLAQKHGSKLFIFHMLPVPPQPEYSQEHYHADLIAIEKKMKTLCKEIPAGTEFEYKVWGGAYPHLEIRKYADSKEVDLAIMGSHTKETGGKWYVGSAVERVSCSSTCPVVVVTDPKALLSMNA